VAQGPGNEGRVPISPSSGVERHWLVSACLSFRPYKALTKWLISGTLHVEYLSREASARLEKSGTVEKHKLSWKNHSSLLQ